MAGFMGFLMFAVLAACGGGDEKKLSEFQTTDYEAGTVAFDDMNTYEGEVRIGNDCNMEAVENGVIISPYLTCKVNGREVDVYASRCWWGAHSYSFIDVVSEGDIALEVELTLAKSRKKVVVLPTYKGVEATMSGKVVKATITDTGSFSFAFNDEEDRGFTLIVKRAPKLEIPAGYTVKEFEPGTYTAEQTAFTEEHTVYYFKKGSYEIEGISLPSDSILYGDYAQFAITGKGGVALESTNTSNVKVLGRFVFDFSGLSWSDGKNTYYFRGVDDFVFSGITSISSTSWTFKFDGCKNGEITNLAMFGYRTFTDGVMISNGYNLKVTDSFMRTGDDAFEVKATSGPSDGIVFEDCHAWNDKAVAFGVIYEMSAEVKNITFNNCSVGFNMASWNETRAAASVCMCDYEKGLTNSNISFSNFEVYYSSCAAMSLCIHSGSLDNIRFENFDVIKMPYVNYAVVLREYVAYITSDKPTDKRYCEMKNIFFNGITIEGEKLTLDDIDGYDCTKSLYIDNSLAYGVAD